ncbi:MAG: hypothetical protein HC860_23210 [Alkalinema sp. RU_4_3]|nr:hypothetical protein [Alkalinema sp. RU_4_3]
MEPLRFRQGDVLLVRAEPLDNQNPRHLPHLVLAEGEATGHKHQITSGAAELIERNGILFLRVLSETATLSHEEHSQIQIPQGTWMVRIQREYEPTGIRLVAD